MGHGDECVRLEITGAICHFQLDRNKKDTLGKSVDLASSYRAFDLCGLMHESDNPDFHKYEMKK